MADNEARAQSLVRDAQLRVAEESARRRSAKPKSAADGAKQGLMSLVGGIGAGGAAIVLGPVAGAQAAPKGKKVQGVLKGIVGGLAIGIAAPVAGAAAGVGKFVEGTKAKGKRVEYTHVTHAQGATPEEIARNLEDDRNAYLTERTELFHGMLQQDEDVPGSSEGAGPASSTTSGGSGSASGGLPAPVDTEFYDVLKLKPSATASEIRKAYHRRSLETHPDRTGASGEEFKAVSDAYQVLSDPEKRKAYHLHGKTDSLSEDAIKPEVLFSLMLMPKGFKHIIGDAAMSFVLAQEAEQTDDNKMQLAGRLAEFHEKRVQELSEFLILRVKPYVEGRTDEFTSFAEREALLLAKEPLGTDVLRTVGYAYSSKAKLILGAQSSVPLRGFFAELADTGGMLKKQLNAALSVNAMTLQDSVRETEDDVDQAEHRRAVTGLSAVFMMSMIDVQNVLREVVEKVCREDGLSPDVLHKRAEAINILGAIFSAVEYHVDAHDASSGPSSK